MIGMRFAVDQLNTCQLALFLTFIQASVVVLVVWVTKKPLKATAKIPYGPQTMGVHLITFKKRENKR